MKIRHVFCAPDLATAQAAIRAARRAGVENRDLLLVARSDIELHSIRNGRKEADTDMLPAAMRGQYGMQVRYRGDSSRVTHSPVWTSRPCTRIS